MRPEGVDIDLVSLLGEHRAGDFLAESVMGHPEDGGFMDSFDLIDHGLDLGAIDILASAKDHVLRAVFDEDEAFVVEPTEIAAPQPATDDRLSGRLRLVPIATNQIGAAEANFTDLTHRQLIHILVEDLNFRPEQSNASLNSNDLFAGRRRDVNVERRAALPVGEAKQLRDEPQFQDILDEVRADYGEAKGELRVARSRLAQARDLLKRTEIHAPFSGVVAERYKSDGEHVTRGVEVLRLVNTESLEIQARTPQYTVPFIRQHGELIVVDDKNKNVSKVRAMVPVGDTLSRLYEVRLEFSDPEWLSGHAVRVAIPVDTTRTVVAVPRDALVIREEGISVFRIIDGETAELVPVTIGISNDDLIEIKGNIKPGDRVVVRGNERLQPGQKVIIQQGQVAK